MRRSVFRTRRHQSVRRARHLVNEQQLGEIKSSEAMPGIVERFFKAVQEEKIDTIGMPKITIEKIARATILSSKQSWLLCQCLRLPIYPR